MHGGLSLLGQGQRAGSVLSARSGKRKDRDARSATGRSGVGKAASAVGTQIGRGPEEEEVEEDDAQEDADGVEMGRDWLVDEEERNQKLA